jgi:Fe(3+) dicitrate transport protein
VAPAPATPPAAAELPSPAATLTPTEAELPPAAATLPPSAAEATRAAPATPRTPASEPIDIVVVGTRVAKTAGSAHIIGEKQLERFEYDDAHATLQQVPGVYVRQEDGIGLRPNIGIRGANPDRSKKLTLMEDGVLFGPAPYSAPAAYYFPLMTRMTQVRVVNGPSAVAYGPHTVGGAIDLVTRPIPKEPSAALDLAGGEYGYFKAHGYAGTSTDQFGMLIEGVHLQNDGFKELPSAADTGSSRNEWMVKSAYVLDPDAAVTNELRLKLTYSEEVSNETYLGLSDADFRDDPEQRYAASALDQMKNHRTSIVATHLLEAPAAHLKLTTTIYRHDYARIWRKLNSFRGAAIAGVLADPEDPANAEYLAVLRGEADSATGNTVLLIGPNDRTFVNQGVQSVLDLQQLFTGPIEHRLELGVRLHNDVITRRHSQDAFEMVDGELIAVQGSATSVTTANEASTYALALHVLDAATWGALTVTPGLRVEIIASELEDQLEGELSDGLVAAVMPGFGAYYELVPNLGVLAGVYRGFSPPAPGSDDFVKPEYSINFEAGARFSPGRSRLELIGFLNDYSNLTDVCTFSSGCLNDDLDRQFDAGEASIYGFEAFASHELRFGQIKLPLSAAYTFTEAEFQSTFQSSDPIYGSVEDGDELPYIPRHQLNVTAGLDSRWFGASASLTYVAAMREEAGSAPFSESLVTDEQLDVSLGADVRILENLKVYANVRNLLNARDIVARRPYGARPNAPRWIQLGVKGSL